MRLLFLTPRALGMPRSGGTIKSAAVLDHLERRHEVDVVSFVRPGERWERSNGRTVTIPLARPRSFGRLVASYAHSRPLSVERNHSVGLANAVDALTRSDSYDAVFVDGWLMAQYLPERFPGVKMLHQHNAEYVMWERHAELETSRFRQIVVAAEARRVRRYEASILPRFDVVFAVSEKDRRQLLSFARAADVRVLPNIAHADLLGRPALHPLPEPVVLFFGTLSWQPNVDGLTRFLRDGFPALRSEIPRARLVVAGTGAPSSLVTLAAGTPGVELTGDVPDDEALYRRARAFVDVGLGGSGTRVKVLNALARGLPVVATSDAADGLDVVPGEHLLVADDTRAVVAALVRVLTDDATWHALSERGRELVRSRYVPDVAFAVLDEALVAPSERR
jgi:glycosyltransferase involved in cell wall biosynthesis